jgi:hypothetical protein
VGSDRQNPALLCCHDWHGDPIPVNQDTVEKDPPQNGYWSVDVVQAGRYEFRLRSRPPGVPQPIGATAARVIIGDSTADVDASPNEDEVKITLDLPAGPGHLQTEFLADGRPMRGAYYVEVERLSN